MGVPIDGVPNTTSSTSGGGIGDIAGGAINALTGGAMGHIMGMVFGGAEDRRQYNQAAKLQGLQLQGAKEMADVAEQHQLDVWDKTNAEAQMEHYRNAGLNPALMYGTSGQGGQLGSGATPMPTGSSAADAASTARANNETAMMGIQLENMKASTELMQANAEKAKVEASKEAGVDTNLANTQIASLTQGIENAKAQEAYTKVQTDIANAQSQIQNQTVQEQINTIAVLAEKTRAETHMAQIQENIDENMFQQKEDIIAQTLTNMITDNTLKKAQAENTSAQAVLSQYEAALTKAGIDPKSPWYIKIIGNLAEKLGINPLKP